MCLKSAESNKFKHFFCFSFISGTFESKRRTFSDSIVKKPLLSHGNKGLKGLCHPRRMREPMKTNLKKLARLFQVLSEILEGYTTPKMTKYQRYNFIIQIHNFTIKIDSISINLLFECVKIVGFNFNSHVFLVMYQEILYVNQDACFLNQEGRRQFLIISVSERD